MKKNAIVLNGSDPTRMYDVACDEGDVSLFENLGRSRAGSSYVDKLNRCYYHKMDNEKGYSGWKLLKGTPGKKCPVFAAEPNDFRLGKFASDLQSGVTIASDGKVTGTLKKITGFTEFSNIPSEQNGYYLSIQIPLSKDPDVRKNQSIIVRKDSGPEKTLKPDYEGSHLIVQVLPDTTKKLTIKVKNSGDEEEESTSTRELDLSKLTFN